MVFKPNELNRIDFQLFSFGGVALYWRMEFFEDAIKSLEALDYRVLRVRYSTSDQFVGDMSAALKWEEQFGYAPWTGNLNALNDALRQEPLESADDNVICLENFQASVGHDAEWSRCLLDRLARASRDYLLVGKRLLILVQTTDAHFHCPNIGGIKAWWNAKEWLNSDRGCDQ